MNLAFTKQLAEQLEILCAQSETPRGLPASVLKIIYEKKWFKLFVPKAMGGLQWSLKEALMLEEQLAKIDGSLGWTVTLCAGANFFAGYIDAKVAAKIFSNNKVCFGGSGAATGIAQKINEGYIVNGFWKYATGNPHLTHFTANCVIHQNGQPVLTPNGMPLIQSFFFKKEEVKVYEDWHTMGLKATASNSFSVSNLKVDADRSFVIDAKCSKLPHPIYQYPFMQIAETTLAVNVLGMARHFIALAIDIFTERRKILHRENVDKGEKKLKQYQGKIDVLATEIYQLVSVSWEELLSRQRVSVRTAKCISVVSKKLANVCRMGVAEVYPYCGLAATSEGSAINRVFRDMFTASQHGLLTS